jgi:heme exporter protein D
VFQFESIQDFISMSGHGPYVWISYGVTLVVMAYLLVGPLMRKKRVKKAVQIQQSRAERQRKT